jgi:GalNAc-alpha-(1->4)-GalNAc-alpha-(1->3)-diNAcBac-PP-undecaprenol alpha-1,4-N-acetyl-D-galactosaminyltransferase
MNIVCVISSLGGGGAERVMSWLIARLDAAGHRVALVTREPEDQDFYRTPKSVARYVQPRYRNVLKSTPLTDTFNFVQWAKHLRSVCRKQRAHVVLSFIDNMNLFCLMAMTLTRIPVVVSERTDPRYSLLSKTNKRLRPLIYKSARTLVVQTPAIAQYVTESWGQTRVAVIGNPVTVGVRRTENIQLENKHVVSVGRLHFEKGHDVLLEAWSLLGEDRKGWTLHILGEGPEKEVLDRKILQHKLGPSVQLSGRVSDVFSALNQASIFTLASRWEGFSNAVLEAMAVGCPIVATDCAGANSTLVQPGRNGELVRVDDPTALSVSLRRLMRDPQLRRRYGAEARLKTREYDEDTVYHLWENVLHGASEGRSGH